MRFVIFALVMVVVYVIPGVSRAVIPANPRTIAGIDDISPHHLGDALLHFCKKNGCESKLDWHKGGEYVWHFYPPNGHTLVGVGGGCADIPHQYCVQTWSSEGKTFMSPARTLQLKQMLEAQGAKVVLMDCSVVAGVHGFQYVCTNGKAPP